MYMTVATYVVNTGNKVGKSVQLVLTQCDMLLPEVQVGIGNELGET
jgi:hypothetical protein